MRRKPSPGIAVAVLAPGLLAVCLCLLPACRGPDKAEAPWVARVDGDPVSFAEFWDEFKGRYEDAADPSTLQPGVLLRMKAEVLGDLIRRRLLLQEARRRGILVPEERLDERVERIRQGYPGHAFQRALLQQRQDPGQFRTAVREQMMLEELYRAVVAGVEPVTEQEIGAYYDDHLDMFLVPETVRMRQMQVKNLQRAMEIIRTVRSGEEFAARAAEQGKDPTSGEAPGRLASYQKGELPEAMAAAAFSAKERRATGPVETPYGFFLIWVEARVPAHLPALEEVREEIARRLLQEREEAAYARWMEQRTREAAIEVHESLRAAVQAP